VSASAPQLDRASLEALYLRLEKPLFNVVYRWLWNDEDARDVVQEVFVRLWRARTRVKMETVEAYAYRIALNQAANRRRARKLWQWVSLDERATDQPPANESMEEHERREAVRRAVESLPEKQRQAVMLCELTDMTYDQIAETLGVPPGTVASRRHHALKKLEALLVDEHVAARRI
jgi:RNA polymerase sigma-70 factor (ECF subfamily)